MNLTLFSLCLLLRSFVWQEVTSAKTDPNTDIDQVEDPDRNGTYPPLVLFYYAATRDHAFTDADIMQKADFTATHTKKPTHIIILCPGQNNETIFRIKKIYRNVTPIDQRLKCRRSFEPLNLFKKDDQLNSYAIGYQIKISSKTWKRGHNFFEAYRNDGKKFWIPYMEIIFNENHTAYYTMHSIHAQMHSNDYSKECVDFNFGSFSFDEKAIEEFYSTPKQNALFRKLKIKTALLHGYLVKQKLIPIQDFLGYNATRGACTYLNTIPVRETVANGSLRKVEEFLRKLADIVGKVIVYTGTYGTIGTGPTKPDIFTTVTSIPKIIWKVVLHLITSHDTQYAYFFLIVVHNQPTSEIRQHLCQSSVCEQYGWNLDQNDNVDIGLIRCCILDEATARKLNIPLPQYHKSFDLNLVPMKMSQNGDMIEYLEVVERMKEPPFLLLYDIHTREYAFTDVQVLQKTKFTSPYALQPTRIVFLCLAETTRQLNFQHLAEEDNLYFVRKVFRDIRPFTDDEYQRCQKTLKLTWKISGTHEYIHTYSGEYIIAKSDTLVIFYDNFLNSYEHQDKFTYHFPHIEVTFDTSKIKPLHSMHVIHAGLYSNDYSQHCDRFEPETDELSKIKMNTIFSPDKQNALFESFNISPSSYGYFVMQLLIPLQDFNGINPTRGICSYMNVTPLWEAVAEGPVRKVEQFIRKVADVIGKINVITATYGTLALKKVNSEEKTEVYLSEGKIPVPKIFCKLVQHQVVSSKNHIHIYLLLIVIHNEPTAQIDRKEKLCPESVCQKYGWTVDDSSIGIGLTYCCEVTDKIVENLSISLNFPTNPFNLHDVPTQITEQNKVIDRIDVVRAWQKSPLVLFYYANRSPNTFKISNMETLKILHNAQSSVAMPFHVLLCCPAETNDETKLETRYNQDNIFFVRKVIDSYESIVTDFKCETHFKPSILPNDSSNWNNIGFKIQLPSKLLSTEKYDPTDFVTVIGEKEVYFLTYAEIRFDAKQLQVLVAQYYIYAQTHTDDYLEKCPNFQLASERLGEINLANFYTEENQNEIFENLDLPIPSPYGHFVMYQLIPLQDHISEDVKSGLCTYLNIVPVFQSIAEGPLRELEIFIRKITDIIDIVIIQSGTYGILKLPNTQDFVYLDPYSNPKKIPVPRTIWKLISHQIPSGIENQIHEYALLIAISNGPVPGDIIDRDTCSWKICVDNGWDRGFTNLKIASIYCCTISQNIAQILDIKIKLTTYPLNLNNYLPLKFDQHGKVVKRVKVANVLENSMDSDE